MNVYYEDCRIKVVKSDKGSYDIYSAKVDWQCLWQNMPEALVDGYIASILVCTKGYYKPNVLDVVENEDGTYDLCDKKYGQWVHVDLDRSFANKRISAEFKKRIEKRKRALKG